MEWIGGSCHIDFCRSRRFHPLHFIFIILNFFYLENFKLKKKLRFSFSSEELKQKYEQRRWRLTRCDKGKRKRKYILLSDGSV
jgi:hypothetical protein